MCIFVGDADGEKASGGTGKGDAPQDGGSEVRTTYYVAVGFGGK